MSYALRKYTALDMIRMGKFAKDNPKLSGRDLIKRYNEEFPEKTTTDQLDNIQEWLKMNIRKETNKDK